MLHFVILEEKRSPAWVNIYLWKCLEVLRLVFFSFLILLMETNSWLDDNHYPETQGGGEGAKRKPELSN